MNSGEALPLKEIVLRSGLPKTMSFRLLYNAELLVREKVDLAIEFQTDETIAPIVAAKYREAGIPMIAIDIPHPGATYYGANNYEAGPGVENHASRRQVPNAI
jgi:hypothetical protein